MNTDKLVADAIKDIGWLNVRVDDRAGAVPRVRQLVSTVRELATHARDNLSLQIEARSQAIEQASRAEAAEAKFAESEAYAKEGWDWLTLALDALGAKTVFDIEAGKAAREAAEADRDRYTRIVGHLYQEAEHDHARGLMLINLQELGYRIPDIYQDERLPTTDEFVAIVVALADKEPA